MVKKMDKAHLIGRMEAIILESLRIIKNMVKEHKPGLMAVIM